MGHAKQTETFLMCIESGTLEDLCELYPKTAEKLKWLAIRRREDFKKISEAKRETKIMRPILH